MTPVEISLWEWLVKYHSGPMRASSRHMILEVWGGRTAHRMNDREFRSTIADLVTIHKKPICTSAANGYFAATNRTQLDAGIADLKARAGAILERARALEATIPLEEEQTELFDEGRLKNEI